MEINVRERNGVTIFDVQGRIISLYSLELKSLIDDYIASAEGEIKILLNLAKVTGIDGSGLGVVVATYMSVQRKNGRIALLNLGKSNRQLIVNRKLMTIFETYDNEDEAVASFQ